MGNDALKTFIEIGERRLRGGSLTPEQYLCIGRMLEEGSLDAEAMEGLRAGTLEYQQALDSRYRWEQEAATLSYGRAWSGVLPISDQIQVLQTHVSTFDASSVIKRAQEVGSRAWPRPHGIGIHVRPTLKALASALDVSKRDWPLENQALLSIIRILKRTRNDVTDEANERYCPDYCRFDPSCVQHLLEMDGRCSGNLVVFLAQLGMYYRGFSPRRARIFYTSTERGLDPISAACILLTHPTRLCADDCLWMDCSGATHKGVPWSFSWRDGTLRFPTSTDFGRDKNPDFSRSGTATYHVV